MTEEGDWVALPDARVGRNLSDGFLVARVLVIAALVLALADLPYGYYQFLRVATSAVGAWGVYETLQAKRTGWAWVFGVLAIVFNPIAPLYMSRETWAIVDVVAAATLIISLRFAGPKREVPTTESNYPWWEHTR